MPFTPAHTVAVLPLLKSRWFSATGLIIGSMAPDFEYFFKMSVSSRVSHTFAGLFYFDLPATLLLGIVFHSLVKRALIVNFPSFIQIRLHQLKAFDFISYLKKSPLVFTYSALLGGVTHIAWDSFTHADGFFVTRLPALYQDAFVPFDGVRYPLWYGLQHISTWVGLAILVVYFISQKPQPGEAQQPTFTYWAAVLILCVGVVGLRFGFSFDHASLGDLVVSVISAFFIALVVVGVFHQKIFSTHG